MTTAELGYIVICNINHCLQCGALERRVIPKGFTVEALSTQMGADMDWHLTHGRPCELATLRLTLDVTPYVTRVNPEVWVRAREVPLANARHGVTDFAFVGRTEHGDVHLFHFHSKQAGLMECVPYTADGVFLPEMPPELDAAIAETIREIGADKGDDHAEG